MKRILVLALFLLPALAITLGVMRGRETWGGPVSSPEIVSFTVTPKVIDHGQSVTVAWKTRRAASVILEWAPERNPRDNMQRREGLPPSGSLTFEPIEDTVYVLACETTTGDMCMAASAAARVR